MFSTTGRAPCSSNCKRRPLRDFAVKALTTDRGQWNEAGAGISKRDP
jgi:hypothetical protein